jgi:DNA-binding beta-propeller fold protein YncE
VDENSNLYVADPEGYRVLKFNRDGNFVMGWGDYSTEVDGFGLVSGLAVDPSGEVWVSDGGNNRLMRYTLPSE